MQLGNCDPGTMQLQQLASVAVELGGVVALFANELGVGFDGSDFRSNIKGWGIACGSTLALFHGVFTIGKN